MSRLGLAAVAAAAVVVFAFSTPGWAVPPLNPSFEDNSSGAPVNWTVLNDGELSGSVFVVVPNPSTDPAPDGNNIVRLIFSGVTGPCNLADGPGIRSSTFHASAGEDVSIDMRLRNVEDTSFGQAWLRYASNDVDADFFFYTTGPQEWATYSATAPADADYYVYARVGSYDDTCGQEVGAFMELDNVQTSNSPPDCSAAYAAPQTLWPPNHTPQNIAVLGVTDPDGDPVTINIDAVHQDEPTDTSNDGDTCPDADGIGTNSAMVRAERVGGPEYQTGDGRVYWIDFTADDDYGASCSGTVKVAVPPSKFSPVVDGGPLYDSTSCP